MSTANFHSVNATKIFAVETDDMDNDLIEEGLDYIAGEFENIDDNWYSLIGVKNVSESPSNLRSYPRRYIAEHTIEMECAGIEIELTFRVFATSGYYSGYCLDWEVVDCDSYTQSHCNSVGNTRFDDWTLEDYINDKIEDALYYEETNAGLVAIHKDRFVEKVQSTIDDTIKASEAIFKAVSQPLVMVAQFSNGEAVYQAA